ncbi:hypothetical protein DCC81_00020 [Chitinophaga parva]|uniref:DUF4476 domain-containing protein n=1 Tax=Chitinophaga parva TaxID=2169414 RepID=A0A2T7BJR9_9BACT|nr:DUF4476 domain-containing protein [Chitinophaga parva]PUZ27916.1 hypothetical protein DCC81_00020 [Chitinophaga parva]
MLSYLKKSLFALLLLVSTAAWAGDEHHFIYIQSEKGELFYVRYKGKVLSASAKGYVIVPELPKGTADLVVGFPKNEIPEKHFSITLTGTRDEGFVIKHTSAQEIALFNLQTYTLLKPVAAETAAAPEAAPATAPAETAAVPAQPVPADASAAMMSNVKKDLDSTFANNKDVAIAAPQSTAPAVAPATPPTTTPAAPAKQPNKFASALDKVAGDDRPADMDEPAPTPASAAPAAATTAEAAAAPAGAIPAPKKGKKPAKATAADDVLTPEEQAYLKDVMADEQKTAAEADVVAAAPVVIDNTQQTIPQPVAQPATAQPVAESAVPAPSADSAATAYTENAAAPVASRKKKKHATGDEPQFIDFGTTAPAAAATTAAAAPVEDAPKPSRKKKKRSEESAVADSVGNLHSDEWVTVNKQTAATEAATTAAPVSSAKTSLNSDCQQMLNNDSFKKLMRRVSSQGNESNMVETFNRNIRNTCLSTEQIRAFAQLIDTDEYRYRLLETAYLHTYETGKFVGLQDLLKDDYYRKRFNAMLR